MKPAMHNLTGTLPRGCVDDLLESTNVVFANMARQNRESFLRSSLEPSHVDATKKKLHFGDRTGLLTNKKLDSLIFQISEFRPCKTLL